MLIALLDKRNKLCCKDRSISNDKRPHQQTGDSPGEILLSFRFVLDDFKCRNQIHAYLFASFVALNLTFLEGRSE